MTLTRVLRWFARRSRPAPPEDTPRHRWLSHPRPCFTEDCVRLERGDWAYPGFCCPLCRDRVPASEGNTHDAMCDIDHQGRRP